MRIKAIVPASLLFVSLLLILCAPIAGQVSEREKAQQELERKQQLERKTYVLVEEIAAGALSLKLPENRSFVFAAAADLLWGHNQPRARNLFWDALNTLNLLNDSVRNEATLSNAKGSKDTTTAKPSAKEKEQTLSQYFAVFAMRSELLRKVAHRDPTLALDMLHSSRQLPVGPLRIGLSVPDDRELEQQIAAEAAALDPERALQMARDSLAKGFSRQLFELLYRLNQKDAKLGTRFAGDIIDKLRGRNIGADTSTSQIAVSILSFSRQRQDVANENTSNSELRLLQLDREQRRELVQMITDAALIGSANGNLLDSLSQVMPEVEEFAPERVALLKRKLAAFNQTLNKEQKIWSEYNSLVESGTPEDVLRLASRAGADDQREMEQQAIVLALMRRRADSLREFVNNEIEDEGRRKHLLDALDTEQIDEAVYHGQAEDLRKLLPKIRLKEQRARAMAEIAVVLEKKGNHDEVSKLLGEAQTLVKTDLNSETQTNALLALVAAYALVDPAKAFGIVERTIDRANDEIAQALLLDKIAKTGAVKKGEIRLAQSGVIPIDFVLFKYGKSVKALANADFDRTKAAADRFERSELRLAVRLLLAQALLGKEEQRSDQ
jgi:hypothetical protein